jgi:hypothetical protein
MRFITIHANNAIARVELSKIKYYYKYNDRINSYIVKLVFIDNNESYIKLNYQTEEEANYILEKLDTILDITETINPFNK